MRNLWRAFRAFVHSFNPVALWLQERQRDREHIALVVSDVCDALRAQSEVMLQHGRIIERFVQNFEVQGAPESYVVRNEDEVRAAQERYGLKPEDFEAFSNTY